MAARNAARSRRKSGTLLSDPEWYKDAIIYELHIKAFHDSNGDGVGDIRGIIEKLDYLQNLGVTALWLLPFYPSPLRDDGYDTADYTNINPSYGTIADFKELLDEAHARGLRIITELVLNHTSDQHEWFQKSRSAKPGSKWREFYVWSDNAEKYSDARIIFKDFESSNWTWDPVAQAYYWHRFYSHQPDLNYDNPKVHKAMFDVMDFWFNMGVDGLRLDAVPYLYEREDTNCENLPETHVFLKKLRAHIDKNYKNRMLLAEANQWSEDAVAYFGDDNECHMAFNFPVMPRMFMAVQMEDRYPVVEILDPPLEIPEHSQWALFLRNHDELTLEMVTDEERDYMYRMYSQDPRAKINVGIRRRLAPLLGNNRRRIELLNMLLLSLPGTPVLYYGDEIGMGDNYYLGDRDGVRTPMQWTADRNAGFSRANPQRLYLPVIIDPEYHYEGVNVEIQDQNPSSLLWWMRRVIAMRKRFQAFGRGEIELLSPQNHRVLAFIRKFENEVILVVLNLSRFSQCVEIDLSDYANMVPREVFSHNDFPRIRGEQPYMITLGPHNHYWLQLLPVPEESESGEAGPPRVTLGDLPGGELEPALKTKLEREILPGYLSRARWFAGKGRRMRKLGIEEAIPIQRDSIPGYLLLIQVEYNEGIPELYQLLPAFALRRTAIDMTQRFPQAIIADLQVGEEEGVMFDGYYHESYQQWLFDLISRKRKLSGEIGGVFGHRTRPLISDLRGLDLPLESRVLGAEQSNTSILYGQEFILKLYRRLENGVNPDAEIGRILSEKKRFAHTPSFKGGINYRVGRQDPLEMGLFQQFVPNEGDAWTYFLDHVGQYLETVLSHRESLADPPELQPLRVMLTDSVGTEPVQKFINKYHTEMIGLLGQRTGEMHRALAGVTDIPDFAPEGFSQLYQRSVYQSMRNLVRKVFRTLRSSQSRLTAGAKAQAAEILDNEEKILTRLRRMTRKKLPSAKIRIHGDYHLGQVLFTGKDFVIIDFEGEPIRPLSERRLKRSALRDVAGMVRSFHYVISTGLKQNPSVRNGDASFLVPWAQAWYRHATWSFFQGYLATVGDASFLPHREEEARVLFDSFMLEKAVYELGYELNNRPDWADIPMRGILDILDNDLET